MSAMRQQLVFNFVRMRPPLARVFSTVGSSPLVAVVGSGPAGFYTAQQLLKVSTASPLSAVYTLGYICWHSGSTNAEKVVYVKLRGMVSFRH